MLVVLVCFGFSSFIILPSTYNDYTERTRIWRLLHPQPQPDASWPPPSQQQRQTKKLVRHAEDHPFPEWTSRLKYSFKPLNFAFPPEVRARTRVAVAIETKCNFKFTPVTLHFASVLPPEWKFQVFYSQQSLDCILESPRIREMVDNGRMILTLLTVPFNDSKQLNDLLASSTVVWDAVIGDKLLLYQTDSTLCSNSLHHINEFVSYDYVGAPWIFWRQKLGGNGGLSLRNRTLMIDCVVNRSAEGMLLRRKGFQEDSYFSQCVTERGRMPDNQIAMHFSVETLFYARPFGVHKPWEHIRHTEWSRLLQFCPELRMLLLCEA